MHNSRYHLDTVTPTRTCFTAREWRVSGIIGGIGVSRDFLEHNTVQHCATLLYQRRRTLLVLVPSVECVSRTCLLY